MYKIQSARIKALREYRGWSQSDLEEHSGVVQAHISRIETGKAPGAAAIVIAKIATALETTTDYLLGLTDDPAPKPITNHPALYDPILQDLIAVWPELPRPIQKAVAEFVRACIQAKRERGT